MKHGSRIPVGHLCQGEWQPNIPQGLLIPLHSGPGWLGHLIALSSQRAEWGQRYPARETNHPRRDAAGIRSAIPSGVWQAFQTYKGMESDELGG